MRRTLEILPALLCIFLAFGAAEQPSAPTLDLDHDPGPRGEPDGSGPILHQLVEPAASAPLPALRAAGETWVDLPCDRFDPGKADPSEWMATSTIAKVTYDGYTYVYGYDPLGQSYDLLVSGLADYSGILVQETVGALAAAVPPTVDPQQILRVELWMNVAASNLFPFEGIGITDLGGKKGPSSSLDMAGMQSLYDDARGFTGAVYFLDHLDVGPHAIDLGPQAVADLAARAVSPGWFGVGLAADGWDLSGSLGEMVQWRVDGGGGLPVENRPFFRVYVNAPPDEFLLLLPQDGSVVDAQPLLRWQEAVDPNGDSPVSYTVEFGTDPALVSSVRLDAGTVEETQLPFPLPPGGYHWRVIAEDPGGATRSSEIASFVVPPVGTDTPVGATSPARLTAVPNPFNPRTELRYELPRDGNMRLWIADLRGRRVRLLQAGFEPAGPGTAHWDGTDDAGRRCASGVYLARLEGPGFTRRARLTLVR